MPPEFITPQQAIEIYRESGYGTISVFSIIEWVKKYGLGVKVGGRWKIDKKQFTSFLERGTYTGDNDETS